MICPHAPRTDFSTLMHSRGPCVSLLSIQPEMGCPLKINLLTLTGIRPSVLKGAIWALAFTGVWLLSCLALMTLLLQGPSSHLQERQTSTVLGPAFLVSSFSCPPSPHLVFVQTVSSPWAWAQFPQEPAQRTHSHKLVGGSTGASQSFPEEPPAPGTSWRGE